MLGRGSLKLKRWWLDKALSLAANKSLLHTNCSVAEGNPKVSVYLFCFVYVYYLFLKGEGDQLKTQDGWLKLSPWQPINHCFINSLVVEGGPRVHCVLFCEHLLFCFLKGRGVGDRLKTQRWWLDKVLSLAANKSLLHKLFGGRGGS